MHIKFRIRLQKYIKLWTLCIKGLKPQLNLGVINLVRTQNFPKDCYFLPSDTHTQGVRNISFSENFADVLNEWPPSSFLRIYTTETISRYRH